MWNVNKIYSYISLGDSTKLSQYFDAGSGNVAAYIGALWQYRLWALVL